MLHLIEVSFELQITLLKNVHFRELKHSCSKKKKGKKKKDCVKLVSCNVESLSVSRGLKLVTVILEPVKASFFLLFVCFKVELEYQLDL